VNDNTSELAEAAASDDIAATSEADTMNKWTSIGHLII
jgi:hypothetical protein